MSGPDSTAAKSDVRTLLVTSVPFWRLERGSHRRIDAMIRHLAGQGVRWSLAYVADDAFPDDFSPLGIAEAKRLPHTPGPAPRGVAGYLSKTWKGTANAIRVAASRYSGDAAHAGAARTTRLGDFYSGEAVEALHDWLTNDSFDAVLVEYVHLAYLHEAGESLEPTRQPAWLIDTHDVMWQRAERHAQAGQPHWLAITREEESAALAPFDAVLAIQPGEGETLRSMLPSTEIVLAPHAVEVPADAPIRRSCPNRFDAARPLTIGFIGSGGAMNFDSAKILLETIWPRVEKACGEAVQLVLAGEATERFRDKFASSRTTFLGRVDELADYYARIDLSVNPVSYGAGLKIKNVEALAHGKALITTSIGAAGMEPGANTAFVVEDDPVRFADAIVKLSRTPSRLVELAMRGKAFADSAFSPTAAYGATLDILRRSR